MDFSKIKTDINLTQLNAADLFVPENFESIKYEAYNLIDYLDWDNALVYANALGQKLAEISPQDKRQAQMHKALSYWAMRLTLFVYSNLKPGEKTELFRSHLVYMLDMGLDVQSPITTYLDLFDDFEIIKQEVDSLLFDIGKNQELLGNEKLFTEKKFKPTVAEWIMEYKAMLKPSPGMKMEPGAFHIVKFMDTNQYAKLLTPAEKQILRDLLDFYNWLLSPFVYVDEKKDSKNSQYITQERFELPESVLAEKPKPPLPKPPVAPKPISRPALISNPKPNLIGREPLRPASGLSLGGLGNNKTSPSNISNIPKAPVQSQVDIDKKLDELEKRVKKV